MAITVAEYKERRDALLEHLGEAEDILHSIFDAVNWESSDDEEEQTFYENLSHRVNRAQRNLEVTHENVELMLELPLAEIES